MAEASVILLEVQPRAAGTGTRQTFRFAGHGGKFPYRYGGQHWAAGLTGLPTVMAELAYQGTDLAQGAVPQALTLNWAPSSKAALDAVQAFFWKGAPFTLYMGPENAAGTLPPVLLSGKIMDCMVTDGTVQLSMADPATDLAKPVLTATYAGTGGLEGPGDWEGRAKRRIWGNVFNVEGSLIDAGTNTYSFSDPAKPLSAFWAVRDKGASAASLVILPWQGSAGATFTALKAATCPEGGGVVAPTIGMVKWWTRPAGLLTADISGEFYLGNFVDRAASIAQAIVASRSTVGFVAGTVTAANTARPGLCGIVVDDLQTTISAALDYLLGGVSLYWVLSDTQQIRIGQWTFGASAGVYVSQSVNRVATFAPVQQRKIGYRKNHRVMAAGDIAEILKYGDGTPIDELQPAQGGATQNQDGANMIPNSRDLSGIEFLNGAVMGTPTSGGGRPADFYRASLPPGATGALVAWYPDNIPVIPGETLFYGYVAKSSGNTSEAIEGGFFFASADGTDLGLTGVPNTLFTGTELNGPWSYVTGEIVVPANAAAIKPYVYRANAASGVTFWVAEPYLGRSQPGADVTSANAPIQRGPGEQVVEATFDGVPKAQQLPRTLVFQRFRGETDKSKDAAWSMTANGVTASINNTPGSASRGTVTVTGMSAPSQGEIRVTSVWGGATQTTVVTFKKSLAPPPPPPVPTSVTFDVNYRNDNTLYDQPAVAVGTLTITGTKSISCVAPLTVKGDAGTTWANGFRPWGKWQVSPSGAFTWTDLGPEVQGVAPSIDWSGVLAPGSLNANQTTAPLGAGTYDVRLLLRRDAGSPEPFLTFTGTATMQVV